MWHEAAHTHTHAQLTHAPQKSQLVSRRHRERARARVGRGSRSSRAPECEATCCIWQCLITEDAENRLRRQMTSHKHKEQERFGVERGGEPGCCCCCCTAVASFSLANNEQTEGRICDTSTFAHCHELWPS